MSSPVSSLPDTWVQRIWATMRANYGAAFDRMWAAPQGVDPAQHAQTLMAHWGKELGRFMTNPQAISYALDHLPPNPPNLVEFKAICNRRPSKNEHLSLPSPPVSREGLAKVRNKLTSAFMTPVDRMAPIREIMQREMDGDKGLTKFQREFWRKALRNELLARTGIDTAHHFDLLELRAALQQPRQYQDPTKPETEQPARAMEVPA